MTFRLQGSGGVVLLGLEFAVAALLCCGCKSTAQFMSHWAEHYNQATATSHAPAQSSPCTTQAPFLLRVDTLAVLEGCLIIADDGQFLGVISQNEYAPNSILNEFGKYGSEFGFASIFNEFGRYGGEYSRLSPFNELTRTPPRIVSPKRGAIAYLTKNTTMSPAVDPHVLIGLLKSSQ